jgi:hypothetical protein
MSANATPLSWLKGTKRSWGLLAEVAVFIFGVVGGFVFPPPGWASADDKTLVRLGQFIVAVLAGLIFLVVQRWNRKKHVRRWAALAGAFLVLSVLAFFAYQHLLDTRTCLYARKQLVIGTQYTIHAETYARDNPNSTCTSLLEDFAGQAEDIWTKDSINNSRYILAGVYILTLPMFTVCIISVVQALYCSQSNRRR